MDKKLYRSRSQKMIAGVCGGLGQYLGLDPTVVRLVFVLMALGGGHGVLIYLLLCLFVPSEPALTVTSEAPAEPRAA